MEYMRLDQKMYGSTNIKYHNYIRDNKGQHKYLYMICKLSLWFDICST